MASVRATSDLISTSLGQGNVVFFEDIEPSHDWMEDSNGHYLHVVLPDFKNEEVKIQVINSGIIKVNGERAINEKKRIRFEKTFKVPESTDADAISAKFDGETQILNVTVPKQKMDEEEREPGYDYLRSTIEVLARNKMVVVTALLAFSLWMFMSHN